MNLYAGFGFGLLGFKLKIPFCALSDALIIHDVKSDSVISALFGNDEYSNIAS